MLIGYDGSKLSTSQKTGTENYASILLHHLLNIDPANHYRVYTNQALDIPWLHRPLIEQKIISLPRLWTQAGLASEVWHHRPDVLFIPAHTMPIIHQPKLKTVVTIHDLGYEYLPQYHQFPHKLYLNRTTEFAAKHATQLIAVSEFTKQDLIKKLNVPAERITVVYEGVEVPPLPSLDQIQTVKAKYNLTEYILFVGTIQPRKNLVRLIEAFAQIKDQHPQLQLALAGGKGWLGEDIYAAPERLGISDKVQFLGYIDDLDKPALYAGAQLSTLVSLFEGFGLPALESMAVGTPVLASNSSSLPEVVGQAGLLVDPQDTQAIAQGLNQLLTDQELRQRVVTEGYKQVKKFTWEQAAKQTLEVLTKAASA